MSWLGRFLSYLGRVCLEDKMPVWATLVGIFFAAAGTYLLIPSINQNLERQKIRSEFVIRNLDDLNARTRSLISDVSSLHQAVLRTNTVDQALVRGALSKITEMQWKAIELAIIFDDMEGQRIVVGYQEALESVRAALANMKSKDDLPASQDAAETLSVRTVEVVRQLAGLAGLQVRGLKAPKT